MMYLIVLVALLWAGSAEATTRYVDSTAGACTGNYSIASRNCTGANGNSYATIATGLAATAAGDTLYVRAGTFSVRITGAIPSGVSTSVKTTFAAYNGETVTINPTSATVPSHVILISGQDNLIIQGFTLDGAGIQTDGIKMDSFSDGVEIIGNEIKNAPGQCLYVGRVTGNIVRNNNMHHCGVDGFEHGIYYDASTSGIVEGNLLHDNAGSGIQMYNESTGTQFRRNKVYNNCRGASVTSGSQVIISYLNNVVEYNEIYETDGSCTNGVIVNNATPANTVIRHNGIYCTGSCTSATGAGVKVNQGTGALVANNIILGYSNATLNSATGTTFTDNLTSATATDVWVSPSTGNLTLKAGSVAIDGGTAIGGTANGTPDQGAHEAPKFSVCSVEAAATSVVRVTFTNNLRPPMLPSSGVTGVTFRKNGSNNAVISSAKISDNVYGFTITNAYVGGDTVDVSLVPASTNLTDSALIGNTSNQPFVSTITNSSCTNNAAGAPSHTYTQARFELHDTPRRKNPGPFCGDVWRGGLS